MVEAYGKKARQPDKRAGDPATDAQRSQFKGPRKEKWRKRKEEFFFFQSQRVDSNPQPSPYKASLQSYSYNYTALRSFASVALYMNTKKDIFLFNRNIQCT